MKTPAKKATKASAKASAKPAAPSKKVSAKSPAKAKTPAVKTKAAPAKAKTAVKAAAKAKAPAKKVPVKKASAPKTSAAKANAKTAAKKAPVKKTVAKPSAKPVAKKTAAPKAASKAKASVKASSAKKAPVSKPVAKPTAKPATKASAKPAVKPVSKAASKPAAKAAPAPVVKKPAPKSAPVAKPQAPAKAPAAAVAAAPVAAPNPAAADLPVRSSRPSARLAQITVPSMPQAVASTAAKASFLPSMPTTVLPAPTVSAKKDPKLANNWKNKPVERLSDAEVLAMPDAEYMNDTQMAFFRLKLVQLKQDILNNAGETTEHLREDTVVVPDPADRATIEEEHALELRTRDRERKLLKKIEQSIVRIDAGDYGYCDETGEPIGVGRLIARPTATLSLEAQQRRELKQKMFGD